LSADYRLLNNTKADGLEIRPEFWLPNAPTGT